MREKTEKDAGKRERERERERQREREPDKIRKVVSN